MIEPNIERIEIAKPCEASWENMQGNEKVRSCELCNKNVYNISAMSRTEAESLLNVESGKLPCLRLFRRQDGTVITEDCPRALRKLRDGCRKVGRVVAALVSFCLSISCAWAQNTHAEKKNLRAQNIPKDGSSPGCSGMESPRPTGGAKPPQVLMGAPMPLNLPKQNAQPEVFKTMGEAVQRPAPDAQTLQAIETLKGAKSVDEAKVGYAGRRTEAFSAYAKLHAMGGLIGPEIQGLLSSGSPAGKVYAAMLLKHISKQAGQAALEKLSRDTSKTSYASGCEIEDVTVGELAKRILLGDILLKLPEP